MLADPQIDRLIERGKELEARLAEGGLEAAAFVRLSKEYAEFQPIQRAALAVRLLRDEIAGLEELAGEGSDLEMRELAAAELAQARAKLPAAERALGILLLPRDAADERNAILEVRAGTGGDEAALFAGTLLRMYQRYAELQGWTYELLSVSETDLGGLREAVASIGGRGVFARLKYESGVHRVQRVPETEASGRIHTSTATVAVLPEAEEIDVAVADKDLRIDVYRAQGAGGQHVNTTDSAVRITHLPTGLVVICQDEKSQHKNKAKALKILRARLFEREREAQASARASSRRQQVGSGDRSERIRTYNFPQNRLSDHRINLTLYKLDRVVEGELDEIVSALMAADQAERLAQVEQAA
ncbi:MAG: peptide chain release factor 1 [Alphaproteobacteria bacterium]|nr:peptide chain release factor 1 [Alphaproteobacteria bacterium]